MSERPDLSGFCSLIFFGKICVFSRPIVTFHRKTNETPKLVVDLFLMEKHIRKKKMGSKPKKSSRILRVNLQRFRIFIFCCFSFFAFSLFVVFFQ